MATLLTRILRSSVRRPGDALDILCFGEAPAPEVRATGHRFWPGPWFPADVGIDVVLTTTGADLVAARRFADGFHLPLVGFAQGQGGDWGAIFEEAAGLTIKGDEVP